MNKYFEYEEPEQASSHYYMPSLRRTPRLPTLGEIRQWFSETFIEPLMIQTVAGKEYDIAEMRRSLQVQFASSLNAALLAADEVTTAHEAVMSHQRQIFSKEMDDRANKIDGLKDQLARVSADLAVSMRQLDEAQASLAKKSKRKTKAKPMPRRAK